MTTANVALQDAPTETYADTPSTVWTSRFGDLRVDEDLVIAMPHGLVGFERCRRFVVVTPDEKSSFRWFQSLDDGSIAFPIIEPRHFMPDYAPTISDSDGRLLGLTQETPKLVFAVVTVPKRDPRSMTANLLAPLIINAATRVGRQVIVTDDQYTTRHSIIEEMERAGLTR
jgi:flagellar assembly factor FliW